MSVSKAELTVYFEPPFWVALYQREEDDGVRVCKVIFGGEPRDQEVLDYFQTHWRELSFSPPAAGKLAPGRVVNPKRARREARKAVQPGGMGTKAQQALQLQREQLKTQRQSMTRERREAERERKLALRQEKRKEKHRGHCPPVFSLSCSEAGLGKELRGGKSFVKKKTKLLFGGKSM